jgi:NAD(P)-dependent dehydrogenase (short-subunit alcohol dehydrogenase family)
MGPLDPFDFTGRVALITGGGTGIGAAIARLFAERGCDVVLAGRRPEPLEETAAKARAVGRKASAIPTDVADPDACQALADQAMREHGRIDVLVNNAGSSRAGGFETWTIEDFDAMYALNLRAVWAMSRAAAPHIRDSGGGAIVNISSNASLSPTPFVAPYGAAKIGMNYLTEVLAIDLAAWNIRVNCIASGAVKSDAFVNAMSSQGLDPDVAGGGNPMRRAGVPDEIAWPTLFLCSTGASFLNGQIISVGGGPVGFRGPSPMKPD